MTPHSDWIRPDWPAPVNVRSMVTTRNGGLSTGPYASMNLGQRVNDDAEVVARNRALLVDVLPSTPKWLRQVHGTRVVDAAHCDTDIEADAAISRQPGVVCAIQMADCMPVLLCDDNGTVVGAAHAGWRGLSGGVIERTVESMAVDIARLQAWLGPAIGPQVYEVGDEVREAFTAASDRAGVAFTPVAPGKWLCDLFTLARQRLQAIGIRRVSGGGDCTFSQPEKFFSHRRDRVSGRMAAFIWLEARAP